MLKTAAATAAFGLIHSALASRAVKAGVDRRFGRHAGEGPYRMAYVAQAVATSAALLAYVRRLPDRTIYEARGLPRVLMRGGQAAGLAYLLWGTHAVGAGRLAGLEGWRAWRRGDPEEIPAVEAQGPAPGPDGAPRAVGPFRHARHPLNLAPVPILWLNPRMTANLLAFNLVATAYFVVGSLHEESRLRAAYGPAYAAYRRAGVPFYLPRPRPRRGAVPAPNPSEARRGPGR
jgi:hypothetical protein